MKKSRKAMAVTVLIFIILIVTVAAIIHHSTVASETNIATVDHIKALDKEIENFYNENGRYPSRAEFQEFSIPTIPADSYTPTPFLVPADKNPAWGFSLWEMGFKPTTDFMDGQYNQIPEEIGYETYYSIGPCPRWSSLGLTQPIGDFELPWDNKIGNIDGIVAVDFNDGKIVYVPISSVVADGYTSSTTLLSGLVRPRLFETANKVNQTIKVYITNGSDVFSYDLDYETLPPKLLNPQKISEVPTDCLAGWYD